MGVLFHCMNVLGVINKLSLITSAYFNLSSKKNLTILVLVHRIVVMVNVAETLVCQETTVIYIATL